MSVCLSACLPACLSVCLSAGQSACLPACLSACLPVSLPACLPVCLSACLSVGRPVCLPACLSACLPACVSACVSVCLSAYLSACLSACLFACLSVRLYVCLSVSSLSVCFVCLCVWRCATNEGYAGPLHNPTCCLETFYNRGTVRLARSGVSDHLFSWTVELSLEVWFELFRGPLFLITLRCSTPPARVYQLGRYVPNYVCLPASLSVCLTACLSV